MQGSDGAIHCDHTHLLCWAQPDKLAILTAATEPPAPDPLSASSIASRLPDAIDQATAAAAP